MIMAWYAVGSYMIINFRVLRRYIRPQSPPKMQYLFQFYRGSGIMWDKLQNITKFIR